MTRPGGALFALDAATGSEAFSVDAPTGLGFTPVSVTGDSIFAGSPDGNFYALDARTGAQQWAFQTGDYIQGTPAIVGGVLYGASYDNHIYAIEASTGRELWNYELDGAVNFGPSVANGVVYASTDSGTVYAIGGNGVAASPASASMPSSISDQSSPLASPVASPVALLTLSPSASSRAIAIHSLVPGESRSTIREISMSSIASTSASWFFDSNGSMVQTWGEPGAEPGQFDFYLHDYAVGHLAIHGNDVYVADARNNRIQQFTLDGAFVRQWGSSGSEDGQFDEPSGILVDRDGRVLVADYGNDRVQVFDADGTFLESLGWQDCGGQCSARSERSRHRRRWQYLRLQRRLPIGVPARYQRNRAR